jgi:hypothetical protein
MFRQRKNPEAPEELLKIDPARRYTREEVVHGLAFMAGMVSDGLYIRGYSDIKETDHWYRVDVDFGNVEETWYFFKKEEQ